MQKMHASRKSTCSLVAVQDIVFQLQRLVNAMSRYHEDCFAVLQDTNDLFPIEVDLSRGTFTYDTSGQLTEEDDDAEVADVTKGVDALAFDAGGAGDAVAAASSVSQDDNLISIN